jgi:hypothetical protein
VHEEGSRESGLYNQKQFEKRYELPANVDLDSMASYVNTQQNQLIVEIPLIQGDQQTTKQSDGTHMRRLSFTINKPNNQWEQTQQKSTNTMPSSTQGIQPSDISFWAIFNFHIEFTSFSLQLFLIYVFCVVLGSVSNNTTIVDIPSELLQSGKTLMVEKYSELFIGGRHLSQPAHPIRQAHGLCLIDTQREDQRSVTATHDLQDIIDDKREFLQTITFIDTNLPQ